MGGIWPVTFTEFSYQIKIVFSHVYVAFQVNLILIKGFKINGSV
jgi:hypothetical protein